MKLTKQLFEDVIAYIFAEPGAMGASGVIECLKVTGETFKVCYLDEKTNWKLVKENFDAINGCKFNGPHPIKTLMKLMEMPNAICIVESLVQRYEGKTVGRLSKWEIHNFAGMG